MAHVEGVLTLVNSHGPWFRIQGAHLATPGVRVQLSAESGITVDLIFGRAMWVRLGWYPKHSHCRSGVLPSSGLPALLHRCWAKKLTDKVIRLA